jgi:hypothetical protein
MLQQLFNGSIAVLTRPSVSTFEEHEQDNLLWASLYVLLGSLIGGVLAAISFVFQGPAIEAQLDELRAQVDDLAAQGVDTAAFEQFIEIMGTSAAAGPATGFLSIILALISFLIGMLVLWAIGRAFGGTGTFGQLAWDMAIFSVPLSIISGVIAIFAIGPLAVLTSLINFGIWLYNLYLTYLGIQAGMDLPPNKALYVMLTIVGIVVGLFACICAAFFGLIVALAGALAA